MAHPLITAMYVEDFSGLIKESIKEAIRDSIREEFIKFINNPKTQQEDLLSIEETEKFLHVSKPTIHKWKRNKIIKSYRIGRKIYFKRHELIQSMNSSQFKNK